MKKVLDLEEDQARALHAQLADRYPLVLSRNVNTARRWLRQQARGTERYSIVVSSQAQRLKPHAIDVRSPVHPVNWFLNDRDDVRSSYYLEDVATEFHVQGLELDWTGPVWLGTPICGAARRAGIATSSSATAGSAFTNPNVDAT